MSDSLYPHYDPEAEVYSAVFEWLTSQCFDGEEEVASCIADTNSIFAEQCCDDISLKPEGSDSYSFVAAVYMPHTEPQREDVPYSSHDQIDVKVTGLVVRPDDESEWYVTDYEVSAALNREHETSDCIPTECYTDADKLILKLAALKGKYWYRGHRRESDWKLKSSIAREGSPEISLEKKLRMEFENQTAFLDSASYPMERAASYFQMQHHGLPTRLLDWTRSPLIALYFALEKDDQETDDACIWVLDPSQLNRYYKQPFPAECEREYFEQNEEQKVIAIHAPNTNLRMKSQKAEFTLHMDYCAMEDLLQASLFLKEKIVISKCIKAELREKLEILGIDRATIYPDYDNIAKAIAEDILGKQKETN